MELKKKAAEVCEIQNIMSDYMKQEGDINNNDWSQDTDQAVGNTKN